MSGIKRVFRIHIITHEGFKTKYVEAYKFILGRADTADLCLPFTGVSREHLFIYNKDGDIILQDNNSTYGTLVAGAKISAGKLVRYHQGEVIQLGAQGPVLSIRLMTSEEMVHLTDIQEPVYGTRLIKNEVAQGFNKWIQAKIKGDEREAVEASYGLQKIGIDAYTEQNLKAFIHHAKIQAQSIVTNAEGQIQNIIDGSHILAKQIEHQARQDANKYFDKVKKEGEQVFLDSEVRAKSLLDRAQRESAELNNQTVERRERLFSEVDEEVRERREENQQVAEKIVADAKQKAFTIVEDSKAQANEEREALVQLGHKDAETIRDEANKEKLRILSEAAEFKHNEIEKGKSEAEAKVEEALRKVDEVLDKANEDAAHLVEEAKKEGDFLLRRVKEEAEEHRQAEVQLTSTHRSEQEAIRSEEEEKTTAHKLEQEKERSHADELTHKYLEEQTQIRREGERKHSEQVEKHKAEIKSFEDKYLDADIKVREIENKLARVDDLYKGKVEEANLASQAIINAAQDQANKITTGSSEAAAKIIQEANANRQAIERLVKTDSKNFYKATLERIEAFEEQSIGQIKDEEKSLKKSVMSLLSKVKEVENILADKQAFKEGLNRDIEDREAQIEVIQASIDKEQEELQEVRKDIEFAKKEQSQKATDFLSEIESYDEKILSKRNELSKVNDTLVEKQQEIEDSLRSKEEQEKSFKSNIRNLEERLNQLSIDVEAKQNIVQEREEKAQHKYESIIEQAHKRKSEILSEVEKLQEIEAQTAEEMKREANAYAEQVRDSADKYSQEMQRDAEAEKELLLQQAKARANEIQDNIEREKDQLLKEAQVRLENANKERDEILRASEEKLQEAKSRAELEYKELKGQFEKELAARKLEEVDKKRVRELEEIQNLRGQRRRESQEIIDKLDIVVKNRLINEAVSPEAGEVVYSEIQKVVKAVLKGEDVAQEDELKDLFNYDPRRRKQIKRFWIQAVAMSVVGLGVLVHYLVNPEYYKSIGRNMTRSIASRPSMQEEFVKKEMKKRAERPSFDPTKTTDWKPTYVENLIYTSDFIESHRDQDYHKKWIIQLDEFFITELELPESTIVKFISIEANLIKRIEEEIPNINPRFEQKVIKRLKEEEESYILQIKGLLGGDKSYKAFWEYKQKFFAANKLSNGEPELDQAPPTSE